MNILALNHFFEHDIASLRQHACPPHVIRSVSYRFFRDRFRQLFSEEVLGTDFSAYGRTENSAARREWKRRCREAVHELYQYFPFDLLILPSDTFPYVREVIPAVHDLGIPVVVVQKETTISPHTLNVYSKIIGKHFPFISDFMTVCSERQKQFWLNAGAPDARIEVTGQPRFDLYRNPAQWRGLEELGIKALDNRKVILFLSYSLGAYIPIEDFKSGRLSWAPLRSQTEAVLLELVNSGNYQLLVKPHPQQSAQDVAEISARLAQNVRVTASAQVLPPSLDTRHLLINADIVIGFQTTALLEALLLNRGLIYTCWGDAYDACKDVILPYEHHSDALYCASSPDQLLDFVERSVTQNSSTVEMRRLELFRHYLGPSDGKASERTLNALERTVESYLPGDPERAKSLRNSLARRRIRFLVLESVRLGGQFILELPFAFAAWAAGRMTGRRRTERWANRPLGLQLRHAVELLNSLAGRSVNSSELIGRRISPWRVMLRERIQRFHRR